MPAKPAHASLLAAVTDDARLSSPGQRATLLSCVSDCESAEASLPEAQA